MRMNNQHVYINISNIKRPRKDVWSVNLELVLDGHLNQVTLMLLLMKLITENMRGI